MASQPSPAHVGAVARLARAVLDLDLDQDDVGEGKGKGKGEGNLLAAVVGVVEEKSIGELAVAMSRRVRRVVWCGMVWYGMVWYGMVSSGRGVSIAQSLELTLVAPASLARLHPSNPRHACMTPTTR